MSYREMSVPSLVSVTERLGWVLLSDWDAVATAPQVHASGISLILKYTKQDLTPLHFFYRLAAEH